MEKQNQPAIKPTKPNTQTTNHTLQKTQQTKTQTIDTGGHHSALRHEEQSSE